MVSSWTGSEGFLKCFYFVFDRLWFDAEFQPQRLEAHVGFVVHEELLATHKRLDLPADDFVKNLGLESEAKKLMNCWDQNVHVLRILQFAQEWQDVLEELRNQWVESWK